MACASARRSKSRGFLLRFKAAKPRRSTYAAREHATDAAQRPTPRGASPRLRRERSTLPARRRCRRERPRLPEPEQKAPPLPPAASAAVLRREARPYAARRGFAALI